MAFDIRTKSVSKQLDGIYVVTYEAFDNADPDLGTKTFQIQGETKAEITSKLTIKIEKLKAIYDQQASWLALSESVIQDLRDGGII